MSNTIILAQYNNKVTADSRQIAEHFGKEHKNVIRDIEREILRNPELEKHFIKSSYLDSYKRKQLMYEITSEGSDLLNKRYFYKINNKKILQRGFENLMRQALDGLFVFETECVIEGFRLDFYSKEYNLVIEYDEKQHKYSAQKDLERQLFLQDKLGCNFIRVRENKELEGLNKIISFIISKNSGNKFLGGEAI